MPARRFRPGGTAQSRFAPNRFVPRRISRMGLSLRRPAPLVNAALALLLGAGGFVAYETLRGPDDGAAAAGGASTMPVRQGTVTATATADGSVASASTATADFVTGGTVTAIDVAVGDKVKKGQKLAEVDPAAANRSLDAARADLDAARDSLSRAEDAGQDTTGAQDAVTQAELAVDDAQAAVDGTVLTAPMAGTVTAVNGTLGSSSSGSGSSSGGQNGAGSSSGGSSGAGSSGAGSSGGGSSSSAGSASGSSSGGFIDLADLTKLQVTADFAEADATRLTEKQAATVTWNALNGARESATVAAVDPSPTTSDSAVTYGVTLSLDDLPDGARPGQTVSVSVVTGEVADAVYVNPAAITTTGGQHRVTVVAGGRRDTRTVQIGLEGDQATQITDGVQPGEQVEITLTSTGDSGSTGGFGNRGGGFGFSGGGAPGGGPGGFSGGGQRGGGSGGR
ncbi:efflux RND transporter periplasmic adaptor subunit [Mangrovihabitans endophyticus]|nr:HlyD family efflux transporter periplasmic adaptor subunit [Mangrovihabitans endophyticus]